MKELKIDATIQNLDEVLAFLDGELEAMECGMKEQIQLDVAVEEIFVNIANYAYSPNIGTATVRVEVMGDPPAVDITFIDGGVPYDPLAKPDPDITLGAEERQIGGLGIFIVKNTMDDMKYEYRDGSNILRLIKNIE